MPKIGEILLNSEGFQYATSLDLDMDFYHIRIRKETSNLCTIILPRGNYKYKYLPMGVCNSLDIFQVKMNELLCGFYFIGAYINEILRRTKGYWYNHLEKLELTIQNLKDNRFKYNIENSLLGQTDM